jgi:hypothetical protein
MRQIPFYCYLSLSLHIFYSRIIPQSPFAVINHCFISEPYVALLFMPVDFFSPTCYALYCATLVCNMNLPTSKESGVMARQVLILVGHD